MTGTITVPSVSFIIPHMGREQMLEETIASIAAQQFKLSEIEVIIVTKNTSLSDSIKRYQSLFSLSIIHADHTLTISHQRNMGAQVAKGKYFAFLDADVGLAPNWISAMLNKLTGSEDIKLVSAVQANSQQASALESLRTALSNAQTDCEVNFLPGRNLFLAADTFALSGGFPEHLETCEDYVFTQRIAGLGKLFYSADSNYVHIGEDQAYLPMAKKEIWRGQSNIASLRGRKIPLSEWPSFIAPPLFSFSVILGVLLILFAHIIAGSVVLLCAFSLLSIYTFRLRSMTKGRPGLASIYTFYLLYFPARTWGMMYGLFAQLMRRFN